MEELDPREEAEEQEKEMLKNARTAIEHLPGVFNHPGWKFLTALYTKQMDRAIHQSVFADETWLTENQKTREGLRLEAIGLKIALTLGSNQLQFYEDFMKNYNAAEERRRAEAEAKNKEQEDA